MADQPRPRRRAAADLAAGVLLEIVSRIPCETDRIHMSRVCHPWRQALAKLDPPPPPPARPLPWLVLPNSTGGGGGGAAPTFSCVLSGCRNHPFHLLEGAHEARYFGSYDGAWLFLAVGGRAQRHVLLNLNYGRVRDIFELPDLARINPENPNDRAMAIVAATLSCKPTVKGCIAAGIIDSSPFLYAEGLVNRRIAFWRIGDQVVLPNIWMMPDEEFWGSSLTRHDDLIYHKGAFLFLSQQEDILALEEPPVFCDDGVQLFAETMSFLPRLHDDDEIIETVLARYLVVSRDKLLMVVRISNQRRRWLTSESDDDVVAQHLPTSKFRVFQKKEFNKGEKDEPAQDPPNQFKYYWSELEKLEGRMLFVGRGCSRSYEVENGYPGMEGVYFLDDQIFHEPIIGNDANEVPYLCSDNGKWTPDLKIDGCFPQRDRMVCSLSVQF
uniref:KIB1-4 beta-propeller domain-containing protein n=1 Tax=Leersia perrieri TaxID=77586 RepID=A0A0D9WJ60_9ORYZ